MKIQCDVCGKEEASVYCTADEAAICDTCDHRVHHVNKLASKHQRFSLLHPSAKSVPLCDVCQDKRAFLFCQQDRAIMCRDCDASIHSANEHTRKHNRFLLTGVKLSATSEVYISSSSSQTNGGGLVPDSRLQQQQPSIKKSVTDAVSVGPNPASMVKTASLNSDKGLDNLVSTSDGICCTRSSTISEYLMETLPGWHVEDFLDTPSSLFGFCKPDDGISSFADPDIGSNLSSFSSESLGIWVPQASTPIGFSSPNGPQIMGGQIELKDNNLKSVNSRRYNNDDLFAVPQISPPTASKRSRTLW